MYAAGILLYEMLTGEKPHDGENPIHVVYRHVHEDVPPPSARVPTIPPSVDALVAAATARDPDLRPANATQFLASLNNVRRGLSEAQLDGAGQGMPTQLMGQPVGQPVGQPLTQPVIQPVTEAGQNHHDTIAVPLLPPAAGNGRVARADTPVRGRQASRGWVALVIILALAVLVSISAWWLGSGRYTVTPPVLNLTQAQAEAKISAAGLQPSWKRQFSETVARGLVVATKPRPNDRIVRGGTLTVFLSAGPERIAVPPLVGRQQDDAERMLADSGLAVATKGEYSASVEKGVVIAVKPDPGTKVRPGTAVTLVVSKGEPPVEVPDVVGRSVDNALRRLQRAGLTGSIAGEVFSDTVRRGAVATQDPAAAEGADVGASVRLLVSKGPQLFQVPKVTGMPVAQALRALEKAGFKHRVVPIPGGPNRVLAQFPGQGSQRPKKTTVTLTVF